MKMEISTEKKTISLQYERLITIKPCLITTYWTGIVSKMGLNQLIYYNPNIVPVPISWPAPGGKWITFPSLTNTPGSNSRQVSKSHAGEFIT